MVRYCLAPSSTLTAFSRFGVWCREAPAEPVGSVYWLAMVASGPGCYEGGEGVTGRYEGVKTCEPSFAGLITMSCELKGTVPATLSALSKLVVLRFGS